MSSGRQLPGPHSALAGEDGGSVDASGAPVAPLCTLVGSAGGPRSVVQLSPEQPGISMPASSTEQATATLTPASSANVSLHKRGRITGTLNKKKVEGTDAARRADGTETKLTLIS